MFEHHLQGRKKENDKLILIVGISSCMIFTVFEVPSVKQSALR